MRRTPLLLAAALLALSPAAIDTAAAGRIDVPDDYPILQDAIYAASVGDTIIIDQGHYYWHDIAMKSGIVIESAAGDPSYVVIDAEQLGRCFICEDVVGQSARFANSDTRIDAVTLTGGVANGTGLDGKGGAMLCINSSFELEDIRFVDNTASVEGGALYVEGAGCEIASCIFEANTCGGAGGAVALRNTVGDEWAEPIQNVLGSCVFRYNTGALGGALAVFGSNAETRMSGVVFQENEARYEEAARGRDLMSGLGGGAFCDSLASFEFLSCDFLDNLADHAGGGLYVRGGSAPEIDYCYFYMNDAGSYGGGLCAEYAGPISITGFETLADDIFKDNTAFYGGGVYLFQTPGVTMERIAFLRNGAPTGGGLMVDAGSDCEMLRCLFANNLAGTGHAIEGRGANSITLDKCTVAANRTLGAYGDGGAIHLGESSANTTLYDTIIAFNSTKAVECEISVTPADLDVYCTNIYGNAGNDWVGCLEDFLPSPEGGGRYGNFSADPLFCDMSGDEGYEHDDFYLCSNSPCLEDHPLNFCKDEMGATVGTCGACDSPVSQMSWGSIKALYR